MRCRQHVQALGRVPRPTRGASIAHLSTLVARPWLALCRPPRVQEQSRETNWEGRARGRPQGGAEHTPGGSDLSLSYRANMALPIFSSISCSRPAMMVATLKLTPELDRNLPPDRD